MTLKSNRGLCIAAIVLSVSTMSVGAQDILKYTGTRTLTPTVQMPAGAVYTPELGIDRGNSCVCSNLESVTVICEDCDGENDSDRCFTHDRACKDAAQRGGIREHNTFYCVHRAD